MTSRTSPQLPNPYEPFVRGVLTRLSADLSSGRLNIRQEGAGVAAVRYVVEAPGHTGRNIVVPASGEALAAPSALPARSPRGVLSRLTVRSARGELINVPKDAIVRNYKQPHPVDRAWIRGICRGCEYGVCAHGWVARDVAPASIVVLRLRNADGFPTFGWYLPFADRPTELVRIPCQIVERLVNLFRDDVDMRQSSLLSHYADVVTTMEWDDEPHTFHAAACERFARFRARVCTAVAREKKRKAPPPEPMDTDRETCVICLEDQPTARKRCRHSHCGTHVCDTCYANSRGLCPVCDRSHINADYPCSSCHRLTRLSQYGYPCAACNSNSLCSHCYGSFGACGSCDA
jgi:hypothetical protein